ncbi:hypothetical protein HRbin11_01983 [bacterium HR11]|nr:hypothetical protein HRbin11_01983 [bacterium HR11]
MITRVEVLSYKCLRYISQSLRRFQVLIGPNASGKSTFLDVLTFLRDLLWQGVEPAVRERARQLEELLWRREGNAFELAIDMRLPEGLTERLKDPKDSAHYPYVRYEVRVGRREDGSIGLLAENFWLLKESAVHSKGEPKRQLPLFPQDLLPPPTIMIEPGKHTPPGWRKIMMRTPEGRVYIRSETTDWNFPLRPPSGKAGLMAVPEEEDRFGATVWTRRVLSEGIQLLQLNSRLMRSPCSPDAPVSFQPDGSNLPILLQRLGQDRLQHWVDHVRTVLPDIKTIRVAEREEDRHRYIEVEFCSGLKLPSWLLSDGTLRFFALTLLAYLPEADRIYLIEEPENGIHPRAAEAVYQSLSSAYAGQVLCATHSPVFLNLAEPKDLLCFARTESGATDIVSGDRHPRLQEWRREVSLGDLLASGILG